MEYCPTCHQKIKPPRIHVLNRNAIGYLIKIFAIIKNSSPQKKYIETKETYRIKFAGSNTAENTKLKYMGAIAPYKEGDEEQRGVVRSGKWRLTDRGILFIIGVGGLPSYVKVVDGRVVEEGKEIKMDDPSLSWYKHSDYWSGVVSDLKEVGIDISHKDPTKEGEK
jgi:hypothetical protein